MSLIDDAKDFAKQAGSKVADTARDIKDKATDKASDLVDKAGDALDEAKAKADVAKAEAAKKATEVEKERRQGGSPRECGGWTRGFDPAMSARGGDVRLSSSERHRPSRFIILLTYNGDGRHPNQIWLFIVLYLLFGYTQSARQRTGAGTRNKMQSFNQR